MPVPLIEHLPLSEAATAASRPIHSLREACVRRLLIRHRNADPEAGERLVYRLSPILAGYLYRFNVPPRERDDLLQECWMRIHRACSSYRETEPVLPWVYAVVRHTQMDAYRKRRRRRWEVTVDTLPEHALATGRQAGLGILDLLGQLPETQRKVLLMMKVEGLTAQEVAAALKSSEGAVKQKAHRAYARLRSLLEPNSAARP